MNPSLTVLLKEATDRLSHPISPSQELQLLAFFGLLIQWNRTVNLTGAKSEETLIRDHLPDSLAMSLVVPPHQNILDIGSGGGLPGIPFAIIRPDCRVTLVEPRAKRTAFLSEAKRKLNLSNVQIERKRLEEVQMDTPCVCSSKATFEPQAWLDLCLKHCLRVEKILVFLGQGSNADQLKPPPDHLHHYQNLESDPRTLAVVNVPPRHQQASKETR